MYRNVKESRVIAAITILALMTALQFLQTRAVACETDAQCKNGRICVAGVCQDPPRVCTSDTECPGEQVCVGRKCVEPKPAEAAIPLRSAPRNPSGEAGFVFKSPLPGSHVNHVTPLSGTFTTVDQTKVYRPVVRPHSLDNYHPQSGTLDFQRNMFNGIAYIGRENGGKGELFDLLIVASPPEVDQVFKTYLQTAARTGWHGIDRLPPGAIIVQEIRGLVRD